MQKLMANTYNLKVPQMVKKVKDLMKFAESVNEEFIKREKYSKKYMVSLIKRLL